MNRNTSRNIHHDTFTFMANPWRYSFIAISAMGIEIILISANNLDSRVINGYLFVLYPCQMKIYLIFIFNTQLSESSFSYFSLIVLRD